MKKENSQSCWISRDTNGDKFEIQKPSIFYSPYKPGDTEEKQKNITFLQTTPISNIF